MEKHMPKPDEYARMVKAASGRSKGWKNIPLAFLVGGAVCAAGEGLRQLYLSAGLSPDWAGAMVSVSLYGSAPAAVYEKLTAALTGALSDALGLDPARVYVRYAETPYWGWNGGNF